MPEHDVKNYLLEVGKILQEVSISVEALGRTMAQNDLFLLEDWTREKDLIKQERTGSRARSAAAAADLEYPPRGDRAM